MAKKSRRHRAKGRKRKPTPRLVEQHASVPEVVKTEPGLERQSEPRAREVARRDYSYVFSDLKRTLIITGALLALLIILAIFWS